jgi:hypothetical protein
MSSVVLPRGSTNVEYRAVTLCDSSPTIPPSWDCMSPWLSLCLLLWSCPLLRQLHHLLIELLIVVVAQLFPCQAPIHLGGSLSYGATIYEVAP